MLKARKAYVTDITAAVAFPTIQGPRSRELLKALVSDADLDGLKRWAFTSGRVGETKVLISRTGVTGELGFELFVPADEAASVWDALMRAGADFGLKPYGVLAMFTLGLEKAYPAHGIDMDESRTPFHVGLDRWIKFDKGDFIGREALLKVRDKGLDERWTGLILDGDRPAATDAGFSPMARMPASSPTAITAIRWARCWRRRICGCRSPQIGTELSIDIDGKPTRAVVAPMPFFDPEGARLRA